MGKKFSLGIIFICLVAGLSWGQSTGQPWWYLLELGKSHFRSGSYGDALTAFEDARRGRLNQFTRFEDDFILLLSKPDVRRLGDSLEWVELYIAERRESAAAAALAELYYRVSKTTFKNSVALALKEFNRQKNYPEADFWLGEVYRIEGELNMALIQYERALSNKDLLETPAFEIEILYRITDIHRIRGNYQEMEKRTIEIIEGLNASGLSRDRLWTEGASNQIRAGMSRIVENEGITRFLTLYRYSNTETEKAHRLLGYFYYASSRYVPAAEHLMFSFLIQNSILIEEIVRRDFDFTFESLENLMSRVRSRPELMAFIEETEYFRTIYSFAAALYTTGKTRPARELWAFLAGSREAGEWGERARRNPNPYIEQPVERP